MIAESDVAVMPYNTRRKILSLPSLGIRIPVAHSSKATSRLSPPASTLSTKLPLRKQKRTHTTSPSPSPPSKRVSFKYENTPPPSPPATDAHSCSIINDVSQIDLENINDEIVEAVISQLHKTGNRPHLVKELATILRHTVKTVEQSANPAAIISSRLSSYIKRAWSENVPCPLTKELETAHPRRTHYYLTKYLCPPKLDTSSRIIVPPEIISPSTSSISSQSDTIDAERRRELSPSPEVDLSSPEYDDENPKSPRPPSLVAFHKSRDPLQNQRFTSPPLERDEKEFTQTARGMQRRKPGDVVMDGMPSELGEYTSKNNECDPLFGRQYILPLGLVCTSSPVTKSSSLNWWRNIEDSSEMWGRIDTTWDTRSPENIELEELDGMLEEL